MVRQGGNHGSAVYRYWCWLFPLNVGPFAAVRNSPNRRIGRTLMNIMYIVAGVIVVALFVYLFVALLKPELFE